jgi:hypothetical protein
MFWSSQWARTKFKLDYLRGATSIRPDAMDAVASGKDGDPLESLIQVGSMRECRPVCLGRNSFCFHAFLRAAPSDEGIENI